MLYVKIYKNICNLSDQFCTCIKAAIKISTNSLFHLFEYFEIYCKFQSEIYESEIYMIVYLTDDFYAFKK